MLTHSLLVHSHGCRGECVCCDEGPALLLHHLGPDEHQETYSTTFLLLVSKTYCILRGSILVKCDLWPYNAAVCSDASSCPEPHRSSPRLTGWDVRQHQTSTLNNTQQPDHQHNVCKPIQCIFAYLLVP